MHLPTCGLYRMFLSRWKTESFLLGVYMRRQKNHGASVPSSSIFNGHNLNDFHRSRSWLMDGLSLEKTLPQLLPLGRPSSRRSSRFCLSSVLEDTSTHQSKEINIITSYT